MLESHWTVRCFNDGCDLFVAHGRNFGANTHMPGQIRCDLAQALTRSKTAGALHMRGQILVAELEPVLSADFSQAVHEVPALIAPPPAGFGIGEA